MGFLNSTGARVGVGCVGTELKKESSRATSRIEDLDSGRLV